MTAGVLIPPAVAAEPEVSEPRAVLAAESGVSELRVVLAAASEVSDLQVVFVAEPQVSEFRVVLAVASEVSDLQVVFVAEPQVSEFRVVLAAASEVSDLQVVFVAEPQVSEFRVVLAAEPEASEPRVVFVFLVSAPDAAELQASDGIALVFAVSAPVFEAAVEADSPGHPKYYAFPNVGYCANCASFVEAAAREFVHNPTGVRTSCVLYNILANPGQHQNRNVERGGNKPTPGYNSVNDTNDLPMDATTSHSRKKCPHRYLEQHTRHPNRELLSQPEAVQIRSLAAEESGYLY